MKPPRSVAVTRLRPDARTRTSREEAVDPLVTAPLALGIQGGGELQVPPRRRSSPRGRRSPRRRRFGAQLLRIPAPSASSWWSSASRAAVHVERGHVALLLDAQILEITLSIRSVTLTRSTSYEFSLFLHIMRAVVSFGAPRRGGHVPGRPEPRQAAPALRPQAPADRPQYFATPALVVVLATASTRWPRNWELGDFWPSAAC